MTGAQHSEIELLVQALEEAFDDGVEGRLRRQMHVGLSLTPAERLLWLEATMASMRRLQGRACLGRPVSDDEK